MTDPTNPANDASRWQRAAQAARSFLGLNEATRTSIEHTHNVMLGQSSAAARAQAVQAFADAEGARLASKTDAELLAEVRAVLAKAGVPPERVDVSTLDDGRVAVMIDEAVRTDELDAEWVQAGRRILDQLVVPAVEEVRADVAEDQAVADEITAELAAGGEPRLSGQTLAEVGPYLGRETLEALVVLQADKLDAEVRTSTRLAMERAGLLRELRQHDPAYDVDATSAAAPIVDQGAWDDPAVRAAVRDTIATATDHDPAQAEIVTDEDLDDVRTWPVDERTGIGYDPRIPAWGVWTAPRHNRAEATLVGTYVGPRAGGDADIHWDRLDAERYGDLDAAGRPKVELWVEGVDRTTLDQAHAAARGEDQARTSAAADAAELPDEGERLQDHIEAKAAEDQEALDAALEAEAEAEAERYANSDNEVDEALDANELDPANPRNALGAQLPTIIEPYLAEAHRQREQAAILQRQADDNRVGEALRQEDRFHAAMERAAEEGRSAEYRRDLDLGANPKARPTRRLDEDALTL